MRLVIQRVKRAIVKVGNEEVSKIESGILVFVGFTEGDDEKKFDYVINRLINLRIFEDENKKMNLSLKEMNGEILVIPNFTLYGSLEQNRPSFIKALEFDKAKILFESFLKTMQKKYEKVKSGIFGADMDIEVLVDGPVTLIMEK